MKATNLIQRAYRELGVATPGYTLSAEEAAVGLETLNAMLGQWGARGLMVHAPSLISFSLSAGTGSYTIASSGADVSETRPERVIGGYVRESGGTQDFGLKPLTRSEYDSIPLKSQTGRPTRYYYDNTYAAGTIYFYPVPDAAYTAYLDTFGPFTSFADLTTDYSIPGEYEEAFAYGLAVRLASQSGRDVPPSTAGLALAAYKTVMEKAKIMPRHDYDPVLLGRKRIVDIRSI